MAFWLKILFIFFFSTLIFHGFNCLADTLVVTDSQITEVMKKVYKEHNYILCPHTATAAAYHYLRLLFIKIIHLVFCMKVIVTLFYFFFIHNLYCTFANYIQGIDIILNWKLATISILFEQQGRDSTRLHRNGFTSQVPRGSRESWRTTCHRGCRPPGRSPNKVLVDEEGRGLVLHSSQ